MTVANLYLQLTNKHGMRELRNMALFAIVAPAEGKGSKLYPTSHNERYDGVATHVVEDMETFRDLPGFVPVLTSAEDLKGRALVNMARVAFVSDDGKQRRIHFPGSTTTLIVQDALAELMEAMGRVGKPSMNRGALG